MSMDTMRLSDADADADTGPSYQDSNTSKQQTKTESTVPKDPDLETYEINLQIAQLAEQCIKRKSTTAAVQAVNLLRTMSHPDTVAYNSVLKVLAKLSPCMLQIDACGRKQKTTAASLALNILDEMKDLFRKQLADNKEWYKKNTHTKVAAAAAAALLPPGSVATSEATLAAGPPRVRVKPNVRSYSTVMDALARTGKVESAEQAEDLLQELHDVYYNTNDLAMQPNLITYNTVLTAWAKAAAAAANTGSNNTGNGNTGSVPNAAAHCLRILEYMPMTPDTISYNTVLHAVARSGWSDTGERAEGLLRSMSEQGVAVNARSYTTCMDAWSQSGCPDRAHALLVEMEELYEQTRDPQLLPNCISYSTVIHAYANSKERDKAMHAHAIFQGMLAKGIKPNSVTYNNVLNCFATSKHHQPELQLIDMVEKLYYQVVAEDLPDHYTFGTVLKACCNLFWEDVEFAPAVFREACERGHVSSGVLWQLRQAVPVDTYRELVGNDQIAWTELPRKWTRNVRDDRMRRKRR
jgi:pentatricopeptide repeat protein